MLHLGDYIYEYGADRTTRSATVRTHAGPGDARPWRLPAAVRAVQDRPRPAGRARCGAVAGDLRRPRGRGQLGGACRRSASRPRSSCDRRAAAFRAYYENMPLRRTLRAERSRHPDVPAGARGATSPRSTCSTPASSATTRLAATATDDCDAADLAARITGTAQEEWLIDGFQPSTARWDLLGQQVFFAPRDIDAEPDHAAPDGRLGRLPPPRGAGSRRAGSTRACATRSCSPATSTRTGPRTSSSTTTTGRPRRRHRAGHARRSRAAATARTPRPRPHPWLAWNPHLRFQNNLRGYVRTTITPDSLDADFRALRKVTRRDQQVFTRASIAIADQEPGVHLTADNPA